MISPVFCGRFITNDTNRKAGAENDATRTGGAAGQYRRHKGSGGNTRLLALGFIPGGEAGTARPAFRVLREPAENQQGRAAGILRMEGRRA